MNEKEDIFNLNDVKNTTLAKHFKAQHADFHYARATFLAAVTSRLMCFEKPFVGANLQIIIPIQDFVETEMERLARTDVCLALKNCSIRVISSRKVVSEKSIAFEIDLNTVTDEKVAMLRLCARL